MNLNDLITLSKMLSNVDILKKAETNRNALVIGFGHAKAFLDSYYEYLAITDIDLTLAINKTSKVPQPLLKGRMNIDKFEDSEIIHHPFWRNFSRKEQEGQADQNFVPSECY